MTTQHKIYLALSLGALLALGTLAGSMWSAHKIRGLERASQDAIETAAASQARANELERDAATYKAKIEYLESQLADIQATAKHQDEQLQKLTIDTNHARSRVDAARRVRTKPTTDAELCQKLADLGHPCSE